MTSEAEQNGTTRRTVRDTPPVTRPSSYFRRNYDLESASKIQDRLVLGRYRRMRAGTPVPDSQPGAAAPATSAAPGREPVCAPCRRCLRLQHWFKDRGEARGLDVGIFAERWNELGQGTRISSRYRGWRATRRAPTWTPCRH